MSPNDRGHDNLLVWILAEEVGDNECKPHYTMKKNIRVLQSSCGSVEQYVARRYGRWVWVWNENNPWGGSSVYLFMTA